MCKAVRELVMTKMLVMPAERDNAKNIYDKLSNICKKMDHGKDLENLM